ncbi:MAG TPA: hypothetical protein VFT55_18005 [Planctomycetota bacterium]|nr:hypothetical protein [Planctomycetota bacterium]
MPPRAWLLPSVPRAIRFACLGVFAAVLAYATLVWQPSAPPAVETVSPVEATVAVPKVDPKILAGALDRTREQRLLLEVEPLRHLLTLAIDVGPTVAAALGMPEQPLAVGELRENTNALRGRWLFCEGVLEELAGPRDGHPIRGYSIYEATIGLPDGNRVMGTFSMPPDSALERGSWVRVEGFFLKLRDTIYPHAISQAPMLVGRAIQRDYEDWGPVLRLDPAILDKVEDSSFQPADKTWHTIEADQTEALWHLGAFVRDTQSQRTLADWRRLGALNAHDTHGALVENRVARGSPMRVFGTLIRRSTIMAPANPAGIKSWTVAWVQVREFGGRLVPIWVPKRVRDLPMRAPLEVRGFYYRWFAYEAQNGERHRVPLFVAADLDLHQLEVDTTMRQIGIWLALAATSMVVVFWWLQRRAVRQSLAHSQDMDARRRRRRERAAAGASSGGPASAP